MIQLILDPTQAPTTPSLKNWNPTTPIPKAARDFGHCIDFDPLKPGDLILFSSTAPNFIGKGIRKVQEKGGYNERDAMWEHAAVYIMSDIICEATRAGVRVSSLYEYMGSHKIRVRRNEKLTDNERWALVVHALKQQNYAYGFLSVFGLVVKSKIGFWKPTGQKGSKYPKRAVYCSELYADAHVTACNTALGNVVSAEYTPASLSVDAHLTDVAVNWVKIS